MIKLGFLTNTKGRAWLATIQIGNMKKTELSEEKYKNPEIVADFFLSRWENSGKDRKAGIVVCMSKDGLYHCHMAMYSKNSTTLKKVADILFQSYVEPQLSGKSQLELYLKKEGKYAEKGEVILFSSGLENLEDTQGKRNDLDEIEALLNDGLKPEQIFEESFRYRKYEKMIKSDYLARRIKETPLVKDMWNEYHWGRSGSGKTYTYIKMCEKYTPDEVYLCNDYANARSSGGGFDFYTTNPAKIVVMDEFHGNIPYSQFLSLLDVYSRNQQHCRFQNTYNLWSCVIICSIYPPEQVYTFMVDDTQKNVDSIQQLLRRLNVIVYHYVNKDGKFRTFTMPACDYVSSHDMVQKAREYEKNADELEALENINDETNVISMNELKEEWGAVEKE